MNSWCRLFLLCLATVISSLPTAAAERSQPKAAVAATPVRSDRPTPPPVRIVYFVTSDRQPIAGYQERLDRVMTEVQRFYREGMKAGGYGPRTFGLDRDEQDRLRIEVVNGRNPMQNYGRNDSQRVREEVKAALAGRSISGSADRRHFPDVAAMGARQGHRDRAVCRRR